MRISARLAAAALALGLPVVAVGSLPAGSAIADDDQAVANAVRLAEQRSGTTAWGKGQEFKPVRGIRDRDGSTHIRMSRFFKGLPVIGGDLVVHQTRSGGWEGASLTMDDPISVSTSAKVSKAAAGKSALKVPENKPVSDTEVDDTRLVVDVENAAKLAWQVTTIGEQPDGTPSRLETYVDAQTGKVLRSEQRIWTAEADGTGTGRWGGTVPLKINQNGSKYELKDPTRGNTYTVTMGNQAENILCTLLGSIFKFLCPSETLYTSSTPSFNDGPAVDAQYGTAVTWDYYKNTFGRLGIFGNGKGSYNRVHYDKNYVNAFWDGSKMTYGDGDGKSYGPLTSLDVAGHEMSHGVTENTANLTYSGESGGLNEATSDIFGTMVEFYAANPNDPADYIIGEQFDLRAGKPGLRRMDKPSTDGKSADCWNSGVKSLDVHYSSGVGNHFYYLLAEGSGPKTIGGVQHNSTTCNGSTITGIGRADAQQIWYTALTKYMTSKTDYAGARTATLKAATDLFGADSPQYATVAAAWSAVSVG